MCLIGNDVVALYPSITANTTGKIVRKAIMESKIEFEGFDMDMGRAYIVINRDIVEDIEELEDILPERSSNHGTTPTMASVSTSWEPKNQWTFPQKIPSRHQVRKVIAVVTEIALKTLFNNFSYKFGGKYYHQQSGGPIGVRATGAASQLVMEDWARVFIKILTESSVKIKMIAGYVDDGRLISSTLAMGMRFSQETNKFMFSSEDREDDIKRMKNGETTNQRMARVMVPAMNSVNKDLKFTAESQEDYKDERLPTLDFSLWIDSKNKIKHTYYQKPMKTPFVIMERSAMSQHQKFQILSNELCRRLSNIQQEGLEMKETTSTVERFIQELKNSGYSQRQAKEITCSGIRGWRAKIKKRKRESKPFYRHAQTTVKDRLEKELIEKESWYKAKEDIEESPTKRIKLNQEPAPNRKTTSNKNYKKPKNNTNYNIKSVMFVPHTTNSGLAKVLREKEETIENVTGDRIKIVERSGRRLEDILSSKDPWKGQDCGRPNCFICSTKSITGKDRNKDCTKKNVLYEIKCLTCEKKEHTRIDQLEHLDETTKDEMKKQANTAKYIGETSRSGYDRGYEHLDKLASLSSSSHMLKHMVDKHDGEDFSKIQWGMFIIKYLRTAFIRQIEEAVLIAKESKHNELLNSRSEWNQASLPRLTTRVGGLEEEVKKWEADLKKEKEKEDKLEEKIRMLRKTNNKARLINNNTSQANKRQKTSDENYITIRETWGAPAAMVPQKNKSAPEDLDTEVQNRNKKRKIIDDEQKEETEKKIQEKEIDMNGFEVNNPDWENWIKEHQEELEKEVEEKERKQREKENKDMSWVLYNECKTFLENNKKNWEQKREERETEKKRQERLLIGENKRKEIKSKVKERELDKEINAEMKELPVTERENIRKEEEKRKRLEIQETCKNLWKLRNKEKKYERKPEIVKRLERIAEKEEKLEMIRKALKDLKEAEENHRREVQKRKENLEKENKKRLAQKLKKENEKKNRLDKLELSSAKLSSLR